ncbi:uncharacterized protein PSFLO_05103 [Pseudozyma flocculosa]|uniref:Prokaryotic-type class I peptide chain release factors domain-containing protein n=1 Tax=Pseudozyma flocculosa TaxID=84751 RepID=A0A5C3F5H5_9BASI|nr:uncharacterized protein PSFLO_05103 [Pseudozyma flocculosa]
MALHTVQPPPGAQHREVPTPLLFLSAPKWTSEPACKQLYANYVSASSSRGYQSLLLDLDPEVDLASIRDSSALLELFEQEAVSTLRSAQGGSPFPPVLVAKGLAAIIAQAYVSSHPLSALQLVDPPLNNALLAKQHPHLLPSPLDEFKFHTQFPLRVVWSQQELQRHKDQGIPWYEIHRIEHLREEEADESLDRFVFADEDHAVSDTLTWLEDEVGVTGESVPASVQSDASALIASDNVDLFDDIQDVGDHDDHLDEASSESDQLETQEEPIDPSDGDAAATTSRASRAAPKTLPAWFNEGSYVLQPHSRKYPLTLDERHLTESFIRGSGPGGQAINKLSTNVQLVHVPTSTRVTCQETRSRLRNRELARRRMSRILEDLVRQQVGGSSRIEREVETQRKRKANKKKKQGKRRREREREKAEAGTGAGAGPAQHQAD